MRWSVACETLIDHATRQALWKLTVPDPSVSETPDTVRPLFLRTASIAALWSVTIVAIVALLALGRVQVPHTARGTAVAVLADHDSVALLLLLPALARGSARVGQRVVLDTGADSLALSVVSVDSALLDAATARKRFARPATLVAQLDAPKLVVRLSLCGVRGCLTPNAGDTYSAAASLNTRSLADALSRS